MRLVDVLGPDSGRESVDRIVGELHALLEIVERQHGEHRPEDLLARDRHVGLHTVEHRRFDVVALAVRLRRLAAGHECRALIHALLDVREDGLLLLLGDERAESRVLVERIPGGHFLRAFGELLDHLLVNGLLDEQP